MRTDKPERGALTSAIITQYYHLYYNHNISISNSKGILDTNITY